MCDTLSSLRASLHGYGVGFDAAVLSSTQADSAIASATAIERIAALIRAKAAVRLAETRAWKGSGQRSAAHDLARRTGGGVGEATKALLTAKRLENLPFLDAAARSGELSAAATAAIADAASAEPGAEARLVAKAKCSSLGELLDECARTKAADSDLEARRRRIHGRRFLRDWTDAEGMWHLHMGHSPEVGAQVMAAIAPIRDRLFNRARRQDRREPIAAYAADALVEAVCGSQADSDTEAASAPTTRARSKVIVRIDLAALLRGYPVEGETTEIAGFGPVAVSAVRDLIDTGDPFLAAVVTSGEAVVGVAHVRRTPKARQRTALEWLYPNCAAEGCTATVWLEMDHRFDWAKTHMTVFDLLDRLCSHHHALKTRKGWGLVEGRGKRAFVAPEDPRHPRHVHDPPGAA